jgi:hypothetical protein
MPVRTDDAAVIAEETRLAESESIANLARALSRPEAPARIRLHLDPGSVKNGLAQLVLTLVKLLHELLERQALRRIEAGSLTEEQVERIGCTLMRQSEEIERLRQEFGLAEKDLNLDLGPLGKLL